MGESSLATERLLAAQPGDQAQTLQEILGTLQALQQSQKGLEASVKTIERRVNTLTDMKQEQIFHSKPHVSPYLTGSHLLPSSPALKPLELASSPRPLPADSVADSISNEKGSPVAQSVGTTTSSKIILTTYPHQSGIDPIIMNWGHSDPMQRGPVVVSRAPSTIRRRNGELNLDLVFRRSLSDFFSPSNRCTWWLLFHISCSGSCE